MLGTKCLVEILSERYQCRRFAFASLFVLKILAITMHDRCQSFQHLVKQKWTLDKRKSQGADEASESKAPTGWRL